MQQVAPPRFNRLQPGQNEDLMGIYDRDYSRANPPMGGMRFGSREVLGRGRRGFSVTAWLIIACVAVFVIDGFMQKQSEWVPIGTYYMIDQEAPASGALILVHTNPLWRGSGLPEGVSYGGMFNESNVKVLGRDGKVTTMPRLTGRMLLDANGSPIGVAEGQFMTPLKRWLHFSTKKVIGGAELWRLVGFQFLHADMNHLLFNMIGLFFFGPLVERFLGGKRYLAFYLLCGVFGSLLYLLLNFLGWLWIGQLGLPELPGLLVNSTDVPLIGASAGVFGVIVGGAILQPRTMVLLFFIIPMRLSTLAFVLIGMSVFFILIGDSNAGGEAAHLGGAFAGWYFIRRPEQLHDLFNFFGKVDPTSKHFAIKGGVRSGASSAAGRSRSVGKTDKVDRILDKIPREGIQSLTPKEKRILEEASRRDRGQS
ncbi:MAG: hypothetical protein CMJ39_11210 [Phycisphaerae bacterium]|nr:hypothetical protein [Phycisphaerae bacterium]